MAKTKFKIADRKDIFLYMTLVENLFINEFLPSAPGEYVKLYIFAMMYAQYEEEIDTARLAMSLGMEEFEVEEAWDYWEARGLVRRSKDGSTLEFLRMVERFYGKGMGSSEPDAIDDALRAFDELEAEDDDFDDEEVDTYFDFDSESEDEDEEDADSGDGSDFSKRKTSEYDRSLTSEQLRMIFSRLQEVSGRTISRKETEKLTDALTLYEIKPEVLYYAIDYCADIDNYNVDYITTVARRWKEDGCEDRTAVKALLERNSERSLAYREIFKAVGFNRLTTPSDREIMDRWFDEMHFNLDEVLEACRATGGIREPSLRYVNKILENKMLEKGGITPPVAAGASAGRGNAAAGPGGAKVSRKVLRDYYEFIREEEESQHAARIREAAAKLAGIEDVLEQERKLSSELAGLMMSPGAKERREKLKEERKKLEDRKKSLLAAGGYPTDYLERRYRCDICKDTGYTDEGTVCTCCRARADEAYMWIREKDKA